VAGLAVLDAVKVLAAELVGLPQVHADRGALANLDPKAEPE
jgi:hypothetical protein